MTSPNGPVGPDSELVIALSPKQLAVLIVVLVAVLVLRRRCRRAA